MQCACAVDPPAQAALLRRLCLSAKPTSVNTPPGLCAYQNPHLAVYMANVTFPAQVQLGELVLTSTLSPSTSACPRAFLVLLPSGVDTSRKALPAASVWPW